MFKHVFLQNENGTAFLSIKTDTVDLYITNIISIVRASSEVFEDCRYIIKTNDNTDYSISYNKNNEYDGTISHGDCKYDTYFTIQIKREYIIKIINQIEEFILRDIMSWKCSKSE